MMPLSKHVLGCFRDGMKCFVIDAVFLAVRDDEQLCTPKTLGFENCFALALFHIFKRLSKIVRCIKEAKCISKDKKGGLVRRGRVLWGWVCSKCLLVESPCWLKIVDIGTLA